MSEQRPTLAVPSAWKASWSDNKNLLGLLFMLPAAAFLILFLVYPLLLGIWLSFTDAKIGRDGAWSDGDRDLDLATAVDLLRTCAVVVPALLGADKPARHDPAAADPAKVKAAHENRRRSSLNNIGKRAAQLAAHFRAKAA